MDPLRRCLGSLVLLVVLELGWGSAPPAGAVAGLPDLGQAPCAAARDDCLDEAWVDHAACADGCVADALACRKVCPSGLSGAICKQRCFLLSKRCRRVCRKALLIAAGACQTDFEACCVPAGGTFPVVPDAPECCAGLEPSAMFDLGPDGACWPLDGAGICIACGDGTCGAGEDACNCPADCAAAECVTEGATYPVVPGHLPCCDGLVAVGCSTPGADGACMLCAGASYCTACGDGSCGLGENVCRCPADCGSGG